MDGIFLRDGIIRFQWRELNSLKFSNKKTVDLMLRLTIFLCITSKEVIIDSILYVLKGILETRKGGVSGSALIKNRAIGLRGFMEILLTNRKQPT